MGFICKKCDREIAINYNGQRAETLIVICPVCHSTVEASSCFGFGPVWPACIYFGDKLIAKFTQIGEYSQKEFELEVLGDTVTFELSEELRNSNYKEHFTICNMIIKLLEKRGFVPTVSKGL